MSVEAIGAVGVSPISIPELAAPTDVSGPTFDSVMQAFETLNTQLQTGEQAAANLAVGQADNLHQMMIRGEQTRLDFELMLAVRNKLLEAYQELMRMQV
jgi:flagellar hook-basal body complex protein FliE